MKSMFPDYFANKTSFGWWLSNISYVENNLSVYVFFLSQMYVHHGIHDLIFNFVGTLEASQVGVNCCLPHFCAVCEVNMSSQWKKVWLMWLWQLTLSCSFFGFCLGLCLFNIFRVGSYSCEEGVTELIPGLFCRSLTGCDLQQNQQESAGAAAERPGSQTWVQVSASSPVCPPLLPLLIFGCLFKLRWSI